jgi:hypothetical protein
VPYKSKAELKAASCMTWSKLIEHVRRAEKSCTKAEARRQIGNAIQDRALSVRWADERKPPFGSSPLGVPGDEPPRDAQYWQKCKTRRDFVLEPPPYDRELVDKRRAARLDKLRRFRKPKFPSFQVIELWPLVPPPALGENIISFPGGSAREGLRGRPSVRDIIYQTLAQMRSDGVSFKNKLHKALARDVAKRNGVKLGDKGWSDRTVVQHVSDWIGAHPELPNE